MDDSRLPNILLIVLDCVRAKSLKQWGGTVTARTPQLDQLASRSTVFLRAIAPSNWTYPSHLAMFTGQPSGILPTDTSTVFPETVAGWLRQTRYYDTALFTENEMLIAGLGLERGFSSLSAPAGDTATLPWLSTGGTFAQGFRRIVYGDRAVSVLRRAPLAVLPIAAVENLRYQALKRSLSNGRVVRDFVDWMAARRGGAPYFALLNIMDAHEPYSNPSEWSTSSLRDSGYRFVSRNHALMVPRLREKIPWADLERGYLWEIGQADAKVGESLRAIEGHGDADHTIVIVTADHGQCFGEGGFVYHANGSAEACTRVPLLIHLPGERPTQCNQWVSLTEIPSWISSWVEDGPTMEAISDGTAPDGSDGDRSVYCDGRPASDTAQFLLGRFSHEPWNRRSIAAYHGNTKYVADAETRSIYEWSLDRGDPDKSPPRPLIGREGEETWKRLIEPYMAQQQLMPTSSRPMEEDRRVLRTLRDWGYE